MSPDLTALTAASAAADGPALVEPLALTREQFVALDVDLRCEIVNSLDGLKAARQRLFNTAKVLPQVWEDYLRAEQTYADYAAKFGIAPEPVFDRDTYVPNPDRWR